jgi:hypothetical protein
LPSKPDLAGAPPSPGPSQLPSTPSSSCLAHGNQSSSGTPPAVPTASSAPPATPHAWPGLDHGHTLLACASRSALALFQEVASTLDLPPSSSPTATLLLARAALFALYWALAALPLSPAQRTATEGALRDAATAADLSRALPRGGSIAGEQGPQQSILMLYFEMLSVQIGGSAVPKVS